MRKIAALGFALVFVLSSCEERQPVQRYQANAIADQLLAKDGKDWGSVWSTVLSETPDADGRVWWQVRYEPAQDGSERIILVNRHSSWSRYAPVDWGTLAPSHNQPRAGDGGLPRVDAGPWLLVIASDSSESGVQTLSTQARTLNQAAREAGFAALFSVRRSGRQGAQLTYGWQGTNGMSRDERLPRWLVDQGFDGSRWLNLSTATYAAGADTAP